MTLFRFLLVFKFLRVIAISWSDKIKVFPTTFLVPLPQVPTDSEREIQTLYFFPQKVRKTTADQLYSAVLTYDDILPAERLDDVLALLSDTSWDAKIEELRVTRNKLCDLLGIPHPVLKSSATKSVVNRKADELESYKDLVTRDY
ncbi:Tubulin-specific chaperone D [Acropora cervicornis]|uniref:Tubulin-specific chaperone D n=1 Tax=Acropora cervicornis TaxID=6130 RepID=A0AAD9R2W2_ACRCE|nr:Tubulin-specific chaperone D [Acropora cervicornis]